MTFRLLAYLFHQVVLGLEIDLKLNALSATQTMRLSSRMVGGLDLKHGDYLEGGNAKVIYISTLRNLNAVGIGGDFGILWQSTRDKANQLSVGVMVQNFFKTKLYWNTPPDEPGQASNTDTINPNFKIGVSYSVDAAALNSQLLLTIDTDSLYSFEMHYGAEYVFAKLLALRIGLQERKGVTTTRLMTAGAGLKLSFLTGAAFSVDYAYLGNEELGASNRISLMTRF